MCYAGSKERDAAFIDANVLSRSSSIYNGRNSPYLYIGQTKPNLFQTNPMFVNEASNDYRLQSTSPAINTGIATNYAKDIEGNAILGLPDIGAYEYQG